MSIWLLLWLFLSLVLLYFMGWTFFILLKQKKAWRVYASKRGLRYKTDAFMKSPRIDGVIDDYTIGLFTSEHLRDNSRTSRKLTSIEISLSSDVPFDGAVASEGMIPLVKAMAFREEVKPESKRWNNKYLAVSSHKAAMLAYLTDERLKVLTGLMKLKHAWVTLAFRNDVFLLRIDTPNALEEPKVIDALIKKMLAAAKVLELSEGEGARLKSASISESSKVSVLSVDDQDGDTGGLQLEDDDS